MPSTNDYEHQAALTEFLQRIRMTKNEPAPAPPSTSSMVTRFEHTPPRPRLWRREEIKQDSPADLATSELIALGDFGDAHFGDPNLPYENPPVAADSTIVNGNFIVEGSGSWTVRVYAAAGASGPPVTFNGGTTDIVINTLSPGVVLTADPGQTIAAGASMSVYVVSYAHGGPDDAWAVVIYGTSP